MPVKPLPLAMMKEREIFRRIYRLVSPYRGWLVIAMFCMVVVSAMSGAQAYIVKPVIDEIFVNQDRKMLMLVPLALMAIFVLKGICYYGYTYLLAKVGQSVIRDMRNTVFMHIHSLPLSFFQKTPTGEIISRVIADITLVQGAVSHVLVGVLKDLCTATVLIGVIFYMNWKLALITFAFLPIMIVPIVIFGRKHRRNSVLIQETTAHVSNLLFETVTGTRIVKAFCMEKYEGRRFADMVGRLFATIVRDERIHCLAHPVMEALGGIGFGLIVWYGGSEVLNGTATPGTFFSFLVAMGMTYEPIKGFSGVNNTLQQGIAASVRVFGVLDTRAEVADKADAAVLAPIREKIEFRDVSFRYDQENEVLKKINLTVTAGEILAIVGPSGSGKTTLVNLIPRFSDVSGGAIIIDGHDIRDVTLHSLRGQIGMVTQQTILFNDTVRNNIAYGLDDCPQEMVVAAARAAHALDFIEQLPQGFDTVIGESGARLSGGERQRISIARALLKDAPILVLDEATSSLDAESEHEVQKALENLMKDRTTFVIAHRLSTIRNADRIIVVQGGEIVEQGTHESLLPKDGVYCSLYRMQFKDSEPMTGIEEKDGGRYDQ